MSLVPSAVSAVGHVSSNEDAYAWVDDPVANQEWIKKYEEDIAERKVFEEKMSKRLDGWTGAQRLKSGQCRL